MLTRGLFDGMNLIASEIFEDLPNAARPSYLQLFDSLERTKAEMCTMIARSLVPGACGHNVVLGISVFCRELQLCADPHAVALRADKPECHPVVRVGCDVSKNSRIAA